MLYNYIKIAFRYPWRNKLYSGINVLGLAIALTCVVLSIYFSCGLALITALLITIQTIKAGTDNPVKSLRTE